jgi:hypothetical protein
MTRHKRAQTGLGTPQPRQLWLTAALRALAMFVLHVASTLQIICRRETVIGTQSMPTDLPRAKTDTQSQETNAAQQSSPIALILRDRRHDVRTAAFHRAIVSKDGKGVLIPLSSSFLRKQEPRSHTHCTCSPWLPALRFAPAGMTNVGPSTSEQHARFLNLASPSLRVRRFASNPRRKSGPRASRVMLATGLHPQPWIPAFAGTSGENLTASNKNAAA